MNAGEPRPPFWARGEALGGAALLALAVFAGVSGWHLPFGTLRQPGAGFFPFALTVLLAVFALAILVRGAIRAAPDLRAEWRDPRARRRLAVMAASLLGYVAVVDAVGFVLATFMLVVAMARPVGGRSWPLSLAFAAGTAACAWLLFVRLLRVNLPVGWLWD
jgi:hypothetical protein